jgi:hypothetical protein
MIVVVQQEITQIVKILQKLFLLLPVSVFGSVLTVLSKQNPVATD